MDSSQRICRFCYNTYDEKDISVIRETEKNLLRVLYVPLDLTITDCPVICTTCKEQLKDCDSFKKLCISTENCIKPYLEDNVKINLSSIYNCLNSEKNDKHICRLCMQPTDDQTVLNEKETAQFSVFFPEINLHITSSVVFCTKCYGSLQKHLKFTKTCLDWEIKLVKMKDFLGQDQKMSLENFLHSLKYHDMVKEEKVDTFTEQLHLNNIKKEIDEDMEEMLKREEENIIAHQKQLFIKQEHIPIKSETPEDANKEMNMPEENYAEDEEMDEKFMLSNSELEIKDESTLEEASPPRKRAKKNHLSIEEKYMILNTYKSALLANPEVIIEEIVHYVAVQTGVSKKTVYRVVKEYKNNHELSAPKTNQNRKSYFLDSVDYFHKTAIRRKVHEFYFRNELPTLDKVLKVVNEDNDLPNFKRTTFYKFLKNLNFEFKKVRRISTLMENEEIIVWRREYLQKIKSYRKEGRKIYYLGETWINTGHTASKQGSKNSSGKEEKFFISYIGSEDGFVPNALWALESEKSGDNHKEMDKNSFENWFLLTLPKLENRAVIIFDNTPYHSGKAENIPNRANNEEEIKNWLISKNISFDANTFKAELLQVVKRHQEQDIDEIAESQGKTVLRLPPYHSELNPMELIWTHIKHIISTKNTIDYMKSIYHEAVEKITPEIWQKCIQDVRNIELAMWKLDVLIKDLSDTS